VLAQYKKKPETVKSFEEPLTKIFMKVLSEVLEFFRSDMLTNNHGETS
jgi:hypothetical protein